MDFQILTGYVLTRVDRHGGDSSILPEELASQSVRLKEEQLRREEEKVSKFILFSNES